jgi:hypothetical protein
MVSHGEMREKGEKGEKLPLEIQFYTIKELSVVVVVGVVGVYHKIVGR